MSQTFSDGTLRLDHVARRVNLSRSHLSRLVREATGRSLREHVVHCRMRAAQRYLAETHLRVKEIAAATGYSSTSAFDHEFIRRIGTSPRIWRLRHAGRGSAAQPVNR